MIPLKLQLKNFLSYGSEVQTIDFTAYHLICLSGKNGHGKSALLDAITWALWGQARKTTGVTKADEGLLRLGQTQMFVALDFEFNGQTYRVKREFAKTYGKPYAALDFGLLDSERDELIPLTDKTIRQTQEKLEGMLNLDAESFVNSAFLRQGQSNEFSKKSAKERKNVLATILGLNRYENIRALATEKVKQAQAQRESLITIQTKLSQEVEQKVIISQQMHTVIDQLNCNAQLQVALNSDKQALDTHFASLNNDQAKQQMLQFQHNQLLQEENKQQALVRTTLLEWRTIHKKSATLHEQQQLQEQKKELIQQIAIHQTALQQSLEIKEQILKKKEEARIIELSIAQQCATQMASKKALFDTLQLEHVATKTNLINLQQQCIRYAHDHQDLEKELTAVQQTIKTETVDQSSYTVLEKQFERRKEYYQKFNAQGVWLQEELANLEQKNLLVHDDDNPSCPLCEQNLSATRKKFLKKKFETNEQFLRHRISRLKKVTTTLKAILIEQHTQLTALKQKITTANTLQLKAEELIKRSTIITTAIALEQKNQEILNKKLVTQSEALQALNQELQAVTAQEQQQLQSNTEYQATQKKLAELNQKQETIAYQANKHQQAMVTLEKIEQRLSEYSEIIQQIALQEQRKKTINELCTELKKLKNSKLALTQSLDTYTDLGQRIQIAHKQAMELQQKTDELRKQKETILQEQGGLEKQLQRLSKLEQELKDIQTSITALNVTIDDYQTIATATGKDGIQALLIEEAIPEIEQEANQLLGKLTGNQAQIFIESLRDLKSGGTKETLDIKISDAVGIRPYEMFSGGEAFRIDFALRIAISKLLARRAGTSLQTLIIDEGFGSQDEEGLSTMMDALYKIQEDFAKVIIVSHLPAMKDQFPVHFLIEKGPNGSNVRVMEQG